MPTDPLRDALVAAASNEKAFHPNKPAGGPITAWDRRAVTLNNHADWLEDLSERVAALEAQPSRPFP